MVCPLTIPEPHMSVQSIVGKYGQGAEDGLALCTRVRGLFQMQNLDGVKATAARPTFPCAKVCNSHRPPTVLLRRFRARYSL